MSPLGTLGLVAIVVGLLLPAMVGQAAASGLVWSAPTLIDHQRPFSSDVNISSVSCASTALCVAVDQQGSALISTNPAAATPTWSAPKSIAGGSYGNGTAVALTATPAAESTFTGWSDGGCSGTGACELTMDFTRSDSGGGGNGGSPPPPAAPIVEPRQDSKKGVTSSAALWSSLGGKVICGLAIHALNAPGELLCSARSVPPPRHGNPSMGDPGFVFLRASGRPRPARLSQYSWEQENGWESKHRPALKSGQSWSSSALGVTCYIRRKAVRCINQSRHGFTISRSKYRAF